MFWCSPHTALRPDDAATGKPQVPDPNLRIPYSDFIAGGRYDMSDVIQPIYDETNEEYGLNETQE